MCQYVKLIDDIYFGCLQMVVAWDNKLPGFPSCGTSAHYHYQQQSSAAARASFLFFPSLILQGGTKYVRWQLDASYLGGRPSLALVTMFSYLRSNNRRSVLSPASTPYTHSTRHVHSLQGSTEDFSYNHTYRTPDQPSPSPISPDPPVLPPIPRVASQHESSQKRNVEPPKIQVENVNTDERIHQKHRNSSTHDKRPTIRNVEDEQRPESSRNVVEARQRFHCSRIHGLRTGSCNRFMHPPYQVGRTQSPTTLTPEQRLDNRRIRVPNPLVLHLPHR